jgi:hypothetical protein
MWEYIVILTSAAAVLIFYHVKFLTFALCVLYDPYASIIGKLTASLNRLKLPHMFAGMAHHPFQK